MASRQVSGRAGYPALFSSPQLDLGDGRPYHCVMSVGDRIERRPDILGGQPVVRGTRVTARVLVGSLAGGMTIEEVCASYRVTADDVRAALAYAAQLLDEDRSLGSASTR
jgi:uncharacterized protein (DUF433 family)